MDFDYEEDSFIDYDDEDDEVFINQDNGDDSDDDDDVNSDGAQNAVKEDKKVAKRTCSQNVICIASQGPSENSQDSFYYNCLKNGNQEHGDSCTMWNDIAPHHYELRHERHCRST